MNLKAIIDNATPEELAAIAAAAKRANDKPAIVVTLKEGSRSRRYVVSQEDETMFDDIETGPITREGPWDGPQFYFGGQWLRSFGRVDEMYRTLSGREITKVQRINRKKVWGDK